MGGRGAADGRAVCHSAGSALVADEGAVRVITDLLCFAEEGGFIQPTDVTQFKAKAETSSITPSCLFNSLYYFMFC